MKVILTCKKRVLSLIKHVSRMTRTLLGRMFSPVFVALCLILFVVGSAAAAITATALTDGSSTTDTTSYATASITPAADKLILAWVTNTRSSAPTNPTITTANGLTWVQVATKLWGTIATSTARTTLFRAMGSAPAAGTVTIDFGGVTQSGVAWSIAQFAGVDTSGTNGSGAVVQSAVGATDSATSAAGLTITLAALGNAANASAGGFSNRVNSGSTPISAGAGYTASAGAAFATPNTSIRSEWKTTGSTTVNVTQSATSDIGGIAAEVKAALCPGNVVTTTADSGSGSLRDCIAVANSNAGADTLTFNIAGCPGGLCTITPTTALPALSDASGGTTIDGYTQTGAAINTSANATNAVLKIEINGGGALMNGITITSANNTIKGLIIRNFAGGGGHGIDISGGTSTGNKISGNFIGTDAAGTAAGPGNWSGLYVNSPSTIIGMDGSNNIADRNLISANSYGIYLLSASSSNTIKGNLIGTDKNGTTALGNTVDGLLVVLSNNNTIGGTTSAERNVISGNAWRGIVMMVTTGNTVLGNYIGADINGASLPNGSAGTYPGILMCCGGGASTTIGGTASGAGNLIAYNTGPGISVTTPTTAVTIIGNTIRNNTQEGIFSTGDGVTITKNLIRNNGGATYNGVKLDTGATNNKLYNNTIHANGASGVYINDTGAILRSNSITGNGAYGINRVTGAMTETYNLVTDAATTPANASGQSNVALDATDLNVNPLYTNAAAFDFTLQASSPAINRGCDLGTAGDNTWCDNASDGAQIDLTAGANPNYYGSAPDMGAFESTVLYSCPGNNVTTTADNYGASLRECINYANATAGANTINFNIAGCPGGLCTITPATALPALNDATGGTTIDGYTQTGATVNTDANATNAALKVVLDGAGAAYYGLTLSSASNVVKGLVIKGFTGANSGGIYMNGASSTGNLVSGNFIGILADGATAGANLIGVDIRGGATNNTVGGTAAAARNLISCNSFGGSGSGIFLGATASGNTVLGNNIGLNAAGTGACSNRIGIDIYDSASNTVGGTAAGARNVISGNATRGISIGGTPTGGSTVLGNWIGTNAAGSGGVGNGEGVYFSSLNGTTFTIGGTASGAGNLIAYNTGTGINITGSAANQQIIGNTIRNNSSAGISSAVTNQTIAMNLIRNNGQQGINLAAGSTNCKIYNNTIHANGASASGVNISAAGQILRSNSITGNTSYGIFVNAGGSMTESYNLVTDAATTPANASGRSNVALDATDLNLNPLYTNAAAYDFTLQAASPSINRGCNLGGAGADTGCDNASDGAQIDLTAGANPNFYGYAPDIGAFETTNTMLCPVSTTADTSPTATFGSLRACMNYANSNAGTTVGFNITSTDTGYQTSGADHWWKIQPVAALPTITANNTTLDGTTQTTSQGNTNSLGPEIEVNGASAGAVGAFTLNSNTDAIKGLIINGYASGAAITIPGTSSSNTVTGCYIGTNFSGASASANNNGMIIQGPSSTIGGTSAALRNVISGNTLGGITISGATATGNTILGNYIGVNATAAAAIPNLVGVNIHTSANNNTIGGTAAGAGNVISGNSTGFGIYSQSSALATTVQGNYIGTNASSASLPNDYGIYSNGGTINLGSVSETQSNIIGPSTSNGIELNGAGAAINLDGTVTVNGHVNLITGTLSMGSATLNVSGNWTRSTATVTPATSSVVLNGTAQTITGNTTFNNLTKSVASATTLTFAAGSTTTINGLATLNGASGQKLSLRSSSTPTRWNINFAGTKSISWVDVMDSDASGSIAGNKPVAPANSIDSGHNISWFTPSLTFLKTVAVYSDPVNGTGANRKYIPGAYVDYTMRVTNSGVGQVDDNTLIITDPIPANTEVFTGDLGGGKPFVFTDGTPSSSLTCTFIALGNFTDCMDFSNDGGATWTYVPSGSFDPAVNKIRFSLGGDMNGDSGSGSTYFDLKFRVQVQ